MADELLAVGGLGNKKRLADMGDSSHAEVVKVGGTATVDTELPAASLASGTVGEAMPTAPAVKALLELFSPSSGLMIPAAADTVIGAEVRPYLLVVPSRRSALTNSHVEDLSPRDLADAALIGFGASSAMLLNTAGSYDRKRHNWTATALASASRTATTNSADIQTYNARGCVITLDVTAGSPALALPTLSVVFKDEVSGVYSTVMTAAAVSANGTQLSYVFLAAGGAGTFTSGLPPVIRMTVTHATADAVTYSVGVAFFAN